MARKKVFSADAETDPFLFERVPEPFMWGLYDGKAFRRFNNTSDFVDAIRNLDCIVYAHNGGKFDFMFLLKYIKETKAQVINNRIVSMYLGRAELRDSFAIIPEPLRKFGEKKEIEYWKLEKEHRTQYDAEIEEYLFYDCKSLYDGVTAYREIAGKRKTIASNALAFARKLGIDPGKSNARFDAKFRPFFFGGRCECFRPGTHENIILLDIHSAYPFAMMHNHATGTDFHRRSSLDGLSQEDIQRSFIELNCYSKGAFPIRKSGSEGGLHFPHADGEFYVTGWEYLVAKEFGLIENEKVISVRYTRDTITFKPYVDHWYAFKNANSAKDAAGNRLNPVNYTIGKIMQNSLYGKLAQDPARYYDYKIVPAGTKIDEENGWQLHREFEDHEIHRRHSLWKYKNELGDEWEGKRIYNNVATGASITGFTRAHLLRAIHTIGLPHIIYCDTDGIVCDGESDLSGLPFTDNVGDWELEGRGSIGHFAGKKLYGIRLTNGKEKIASKGSKLAFQDLERIIRGETVTWKNAAPTFSIDGTAKFVQRSIRATAHIS